MERLDRAGVLTDRALLAHCVHVAPAEIHAVADTGATVVCNPRSNMNNAVGHSPLQPRAPPAVALGTDGIGGDLFAESQVGFFRAREADVATAGDWPLARLADGARFAGRVHGEPLLGTLRAGAPADLVVLDYPTPTPVTADNLVGHWVFGLVVGPGARRAGRRRARRRRPPVDARRRGGGGRRGRRRGRAPVGPDGRDPRRTPSNR